MEQKFNAYVLLLLLVLGAGLLSGCDLSELVRIERTAAADKAVTNDPG